MIQKRSGFFMLLLIAATCCLCGCTKPHPPAGSKPTTGPSISEPATPTSQPENTVTAAPTGPTATSTATPTPTATSSPTPSPTPTATPTPTPSPTPTPTPTPIPTVPPAPVAVNADTTTLDFIINRDYPLTENYVPTDLVVPDIPFSFSETYLDKRKLRKVAAEALEDLYNAAKREEGLTIYGVSGYRSYDRQYEIYGGKLANGIDTIQHTNLYSAAPGNSEHQTGLAMDVSCKSIGYALKESFANTKEGIWLRENCWRFGFILRYQKGKEHITGYAYEPWHIRYVGVPLAYYLYTNNLTLEEYYGSPSSHTLEELADTPLIDMTTERFYKLYASTNGGELIYNADGTILVSNVTGFPLLKAYIKDAEDNVIQVNNVPFYLEPAIDINGNYAQDAEGNLCFAKPYFDEEGNLWLDYNNAPFFLQPLWNADGTLAYDAEGNLLYTEPETDLFGMVIITETGSLTPKVPIRDENGELTFHPDGTVAFYEPFINPLTGDYILDSASGLPLYPSGYYLVPHNTLPLPGYKAPEEIPPQEPEENPTDTPVEEPIEEPTPTEPVEEPTPEPTVDPMPEPTVEPTPTDAPTDSSEPEVPTYDTTDETGGFLE